MNNYKFKTNINCGGCVAGVTPFLNKLENTDWQVDTENPDKILSVQSDSVSEKEIIEAVKSAGFEIEVV